MDSPGTLNNLEIAWRMVSYTVGAIASFAFAGRMFVISSRHGRSLGAVLIGYGLVALALLALLLHYVFTGNRDPVWSQLVFDFVAATMWLPLVLYVQFRNGKS